MAAKIVAGLRWSARITGVLLVGMVLLFAVGEGVPKPFDAPVPVQVEIGGMLLVLAGCLLGWWREAWGGAMVICGFAAFLATGLFVNGKPPGGAIPLFVVPGLLYLATWIATRQRPVLAAR